MYETEEFLTARKKVRDDFEDQKKVGSTALTLLSKKSTLRETDEFGRFVEQLARPGLPSDQLDHKVRESTRISTCKHIKHAYKQARK